MTARERSELAQGSGAATSDGTRPADVPDTIDQRRPSSTRSRWSCGSQATSSPAGLRRCSIRPPCGVSRPDVSLKRCPWALVSFILGRARLVRSVGARMVSRALPALVRKS